MKKASLVWVVASVVGLFLGIMFTVTSDMTGFKHLGSIILSIAMLSLFINVFYAISLWFKFKKGHGLDNLKAGYILLSFLFVIVGLVGAFLTIPEGLMYFIVGLAMLALVFVVKLITTIFSKEEDFQ